MPADELQNCPRCRRDAGQAYRAVSQDPTSLRVLIRCDACRHRWSMIVPQDSMAPDARARLMGHAIWPESS